MKILAIRGKNIASLEGEFAVDFQSEPLLSAGLFAITGPTGAGKSTLLDVLCLALFDKTPRMNRARENGVLLPDVLDKTLSQNDCRSLLRRGKSEGYAEADFLACNGDSYRSRWSVRRAHNRSEGSLQSSEIRLYNLHTGQEEQGGKSDLLQRISQLLGLSFEQFTRAVLLAQGDFAAFLKAPEEEKADLLEKLTGSEIYSQISKTIYTRHKDLKEQYDALLGEIAHIPLLTPEESAALSKERDTRQQNLQTTDSLLTKLLSQRRWIEEYHNLKHLLKEAEINWQTASQQWENAKARRENIAQYDLAQEIRDSYNERQRVLADKKNVTEQLATCEKEKSRQEEELERKEREKNEAEQQLLRLKGQWENGAEERTRAQELDTNLAVIRESLSRIQKSFNETEQIWRGELEEKKKTEESLAEKEKNFELLSQWLQQQKGYQPIVAKAEVIQKDFTSWEKLQEELQNQQKAYQHSCLSLSQTESEVEALQREEERLEATRPSEVYLLRASLVEGEPCPVCGSTHHFFTAEKVESLQYEELERQKKENADRLQEAKQRVEKENRAKESIQTLVSSLSRQMEEIEQNLNDLLGAFLPQWKRENRLGERIQRFATTWNQKEEEHLRLETEIQNLRKGLPDLKKRVDQYEEAKNRSAAELQDERERQDGLGRERSQILGGHPLNEVQERQEQQEKMAEAAKVQKEQEWAEESLRHTQNLGKQKQLQQQLAALQQKEEEKEREINEWLSTHPILTEQQLAEVLAYTPAWIAEEKERLNQLKKQVTTTENTCQVQLENVRRHEAKEEKSDTLRPEELQQQINNLTEQQNADRYRISEINARLDDDSRHQEDIQQLKKRQEKLFQEKENWASLNEMFGSADGFKFRRIAQGYTLDRLLIYANLHLKDLSARYTLQRVADRLALQVCDNDMLGEIRSVHTLSGGETFLISLALALGLSSLSSYRMNIESLFIDEGFGSLDAETLTLAMDALSRLQIQGRKIGVISHVAEMTERIPVQIQVCRLANSHSQIKVTGV